MLRNDEVIHTWSLIAKLIDNGDILTVDQQGIDPCVIDDVLMLWRGQAKVQWHQDGAYLAGRIKTLKKKMGVGTEDANPVALCDPY